jgi:hypothetical protein
MTRIYIILSLFFFSCSSAYHDNAIVPVVNNLSYQIKLVDSLNVDLNEFVYAKYSKHQIWEDSLFFGLSPGAEPNTISVFNLKNEHFVKKIKIDRNFFKNDISSFYIHNPDSIYFLSFQSKNIYLIDNDGKKKNEWNISFLGENPFGEIDFMFPTFVMYNSFYFDGEKNQIVCSIVSQRFHELAGDSNLPSIAIIDLNLGKITKAFSPPIGKIKSRRNNFYPDDISVVQITLHDGIVYASYPIDQLIYQYDLETGELLRISPPFAGEEELKFLPPMAYDIKKDRSKAWVYRIQTPYFENLRYHSDSKIFSRVFHHFYESSESTVNKGQFRTSTIFLFDKNLNLVGKEIVQNSKLGAFGSVSTKDGYLSAPHDFYQKDEKFLNHKYHYKIKKI